MKKEKFINRKCKLSFKSGFVIEGILLEANDYGVTFQTDEQTSFLSFDIISDIKVLNNAESL